MSDVNLIAVQRSLIKETLVSGIRIMGFALLLLTAAAAGAQEPVDRYPSRPVRIVVAFPPGQGIDVFARVLAQRMGERTGQQFIVDNRPGASGIIGTEIGARAQPDGYTLTMVSIGTFAGNPNLFPKLPYHPEKDFTAVSWVSTVPLVMVSSATFPPTSVRELIEYAKSRPGQITYATTGNGNTSHLLMEQFRSVTGTDLVQVNYKGSGAAHTDMIAGRVALMIDTAVAIAPHVQAGRMRGLAVANDKRSSVLPGVPTFVESGLPGFVHPSWFGVVVPRGTPTPIVAKLNRLLVESVREPEMKARLDQLGFEAVGTSPAEFAALIHSELAKWGKVIRDANIRLE